MKSVFLILYLWHGGTRGGPAITVAPMPSLAACQQVGTQAKTLADSQPREHEREGWGIASEGDFRPAVFRCIEVLR